MALWEIDEEKGSIRLKQYPKPPPALDYATITEGAPIALVYGKTRLRSPALAWWGDQTLRNNIISSGGDGTTAFDEVHVGLHIALAHGPLDDLTKIWVGDKEVWSGSAITEGIESDGGYEFQIDALKTNSNVFGGLWTGGFFSGRVRWFPGNTTQTANSYLDDNVGGVNSAYLGVSYVVLYGNDTANSFQIGRDVRPPTIHFEVEHYPDALNGGGTSNIDDDANPAEVIYDLLTGGYGRLGLPASSIDSTSFIEAAEALKSGATIPPPAQSSPTEFEGVSFEVAAKTPAVDVINSIARHIDAAWYVDPLTQKLVLKLIREDYVLGSVPSFDESDLADGGVLEWEQDMGDQTINEVKVRFPLRSAEYNEKQGTSQNMAVYHGVDDESGRSLELEFPMVRSIQAAIRIAGRELLTLSTPRQTAKMAFKRTVIELRPGGVFKWSHPDYLVVDRLMRVIAIDWGTKQDGRIVIDMAQDVFALDSVLFESPDYADPPVPVTPLESTTTKTIEAPLWFMYNAEIQGLVTSREAIRLFFMAESASVLEAQFRAWTSINSNPYFNSEVAREDMVQTADVETEYPRTLEPYDTGTGLRINDATAGFAASLGSASVAEIRDGANMLIVSSASSHEIIAYESFTDEGGGVYTLNNVWRGMLDTVPQTWAVNSKVWLLQGVFLGNLGAYAFLSGQGVDIKYSPRNVTTGEELDITGVTAESLPFILERYDMPYAPDNVEFVQSPARAGEVAVNEYPGVTVLNETNKQIVEAELVGTWKRRASATTSIRRGDDASEAVVFGTEYSTAADDGGGYTDLAKTVNSTDTIELCPDPDDASYPTGIGAGAGQLRVQTTRNTPSPTVQNYQDYEMPAEFSAYRQLLPNPSFDAGSDGWTTASGNVTYVSDNDAYGFQGGYVEGAAVVGGSIERTIHVANLSPSGKRARLRFYYRSTGTFGDCVTATIYAEDSDDVVLQEISSFQLAALNTAWLPFLVDIGELDASTTQIRVKFDLSFSDGGPVGAVDHCDLRLFGGIRDDLVNGGFFLDTASWTLSNMSRITSGVTESLGALSGDSGVATCSAYQDVNFPTQFANDDIVHLRSIRRETDANSTGQVTLTVRQTSDDAVVDTIETSAETLNDGDWHIRDLYIKVASITGNYIRAEFDGVRLSGTPLNALWDDVSVNMYTAAANPREITPITVIANGTSTSDVSTDFNTASGLATPYYWNCLAVLTTSAGGVTSPTGVTGGGLTWVSVGTAIIAGDLNLSLWRALGPSTSSTALTVAYGAVSRTSVSYVWFEAGGVTWEGANGSGAVIQQDTDTQTGGGNPSVSLSAFENAANLMVAIAVDDQDGLTVDTDFTTLQQVGGLTPTTGLWVTHATGETTNDATASAGASAVWALELKSRE